MTLPLEGIRVIDMSWMWSGPYCALQLAHLGAEVIRIESHQRPCMNRRVPPYAGDEPGLNRAGSFNQWNQGKRSVALDMKKPGAVDLARELISKSDVFIENYAVGVVDRLGLGWKDLGPLNPRLVMCSLSGYGVTGPHKDRVAFGTPLTMISGLAALSGYQGLGPSEIGLSYGDPNGGLHAATAILAALWERESSGLGQYIDLSQLESLVAILAEGILPVVLDGDQPLRATNRDQLMAPHGIYPAAGEDRWIGIVARHDRDWLALARVLGGGLDTDPRFTTRALRKEHEDALDAIISAWTSNRSEWHATEALQAAGVPASPVMDMRDVAEDPHLADRNFWVELPHPEIGVQRHAGIPWKFSGTPLHVRSTAPCLGEANEYVVRDILGRTEDEYERLVADEVLY